MERATRAREHSRQICEQCDNQRSSASFEARPSLSPPVFKTPGEAESKSEDEAGSSHVDKPPAAAETTTPKAQGASAEAVLAPLDINSPHKPRQPHDTKAAAPKRRLLAISDNRLPTADDADF